MKKQLTAWAWTASVMLVACLVLAGCKDNKKKVYTLEDEDDEENTELVGVPEQPDVDEDDAVDVINARDFILALKSNSHIRVITNDPLNLTDAIDELIEEGKLRRYMVNDVPRTEPGLYWEPEYDGNSLYIVKRHDLIIEAVHEDKGFLIVTPSYADVLHFENCENLVIKNLIMGHQVTGTCVGDVLVLNNCKNITVEDCELFGCGVNALSTSHSSIISVHGTKLYGCSDRGVDLYSTENIGFDKCEIFNNGSGMYVDPYCKNITFDKCNFHDNRGQLFLCYAKTTVKNSQIVHHHDDFTDNVKLLNCEVQMDYSEAEELPDIDPDYEEDYDAE